MQLHAFDKDGKLVNAKQALKHFDYACMECRQVVRLRGGPHRQSHFYHKEPNYFCRQHQKGLLHWQIQFHFLRQLPVGDCKLEVPFPNIRRIADVVWISQKIVFEIQCSPISAQEVLNRNKDYQQEGWRVVWVLHDERYNQIRMTSAEIALRGSPHYYSNINQKGIGIVYDQFDFCDKDIRIKRLPPLPIDLRSKLKNVINANNSFPLQCLNQRAIQWNFSLSGDLLSLFYDHPTCHYLQQALQIEKQFYTINKIFNWRNLPLHIWQKGIVKSYHTLFAFILERACR